MKTCVSVVAMRKAFRRLGFAADDFERCGFMVNLAEDEASAIEIAGSTPQNTVVFITEEVTPVDVGGISSITIMQPMGKVVALFLATNSIHRHQIESCQRTFMLLPTTTLQEVQETIEWAIQNNKLICKRSAE